jgi:predicted RNase H-like HicB family nuclease
MQYRVELIPSDEGFAVSGPELPGCWSQGKTEEEALENIKSAIADYLAAVDDVNQRKQTRFVEVVAS